MILKADISKTSPGRYLFLFIFMCGNSKCIRIQKIKIFSGEVNWVLLALNMRIMKDKFVFFYLKIGTAVKTHLFIFYFTSEMIFLHGRFGMMG